MKSMKNTMKCLVAVLMMTMAFAVTGITAQAMEATYNPTKRTDLTKESNAVIKTYVVPSNSEIVIPINIAGKGGLDMVFAGQDDPYTSYYDLYARLCSDAAGMNSLDSIGYFGTDPEGATVGFTGKTVAYLIIENDSDNYDLQFSFAADFISGADRKTTSGKNTAIYQNDGSKWVYTTFKATKTGYIAVSAAAVNNYGVDVKLMNGKKAYSEVESVYNGTVYYGVQKGKTYRIATKAYEGVLYNIKVKQTTVKEKSGSNKSKAVTMKKKKTYKGVQIANKKKSGTDWYKIKLTSRKALKITVNGRTSGYGDLMIKITGGSGRWRSNTGDIPQAGKTTYTTNTLSAGTYYIQVYKTSKLASGYYTLSWK